MNIHTPIFKGIGSITNTLGLVSTVGVVVCLALIGVSIYQTGRLKNAASDRLALETSHQQHTTSQLAKDALRLQVAVGDEDWDSIDRLFEDLIEDTAHWIGSHDELQKNQIGSVTLPGSRESVSDLLDRARYPLSSMKRSMDELEKITRSIIRRAPYIDQKSQSLVVSATGDLIDVENEYQLILDQIRTAYAHHASASMNQSIGSLRRTQLMMLGSLLVLISLGIAPRLNGQSQKIHHLCIENKRRIHEIDDRWSWLSAFGSAIHSPLNSIRESAHKITQDDLDESVKSEHQELLVDTSSRVLNLVEDIRKLSRLECGDQQPQCEPTDPRSVLDAIVSEFQKHALARGIELKVTAEESCPDSIQSDPDRLYQILSKIVSNAIAFTSKGSVEVHATLEEINDRSMLVFRVADTGVGIDPSEFGKVFEPFEQIEEAGSRDDLGAGLGLSIAQSLADSLGGTIKLDSAKGAGCFVTITIDPGSIESQEDRTEDQAEDQQRLAA